MAEAKPLKHLYLVDGSGFIFRAFHAIRPLNRPDGTPVNAVFGFTRMLMKLLRDTECRSYRRHLRRGAAKLPQRHLSRL